MKLANSSTRLCLAVSCCLLASLISQPWSVHGVLVPTGTIAQYGDSACSTAPPSNPCTSSAISPSLIATHCMNCQAMVGTAPNTQLFQSSSLVECLSPTTYRMRAFYPGLDCGAGGATLWGTVEGAFGACLCASGHSDVCYRWTGSCVEQSGVVQLTLKLNKVYDASTVEALKTDLRNDIATSLGVDISRIVIVVLPPTRLLSDNRVPHEQSVRMQTTGGMLVEVQILPGQGLPAETLATNLVEQLSQANSTLLARNTTKLLDSTYLPQQANLTLCDDGVARASCPPSNGTSSSSSGVGGGQSPSSSSGTTQTSLSSASSSSGLSQPGPSSSSTSVHSAAVSFRVGAGVFVLVSVLACMLACLTM